MVYDERDEEDETVHEAVAFGAEVPESLVGQIAYFHGVARAKGWWDVAEDEADPGRAHRNVMELLFLITGELTEAGEEYRDGHPLADIYYGPSGKPEGFVVELADGYIRLLDMIGGLGLSDVFREALAIKAQFNATRSYRHGGKLS